MVKKDEVEPYIIWITRSDDKLVAGPDIVNICANGTEIYATYYAKTHGGDDNCYVYLVPERQIRIFKLEAEGTAVEL